jgi:hypothetical protein
LKYINHDFNESAFLRAWWGWAARERGREQLPGIFFLFVYFLTLLRCAPTRSQLSFNLSKSMHCDVAAIIVLLAVVEENPRSSVPERMW